MKKNVVNLQELKKYGILVPCEVTEIVQTGFSFYINARWNSYQFESSLLSFDPTFYIKNNTINSWVDPTDAGIYVVDVSAIRRAHKQYEREQRQKERSHGGWWSWTIADFFVHIVHIFDDIF